jgi:hypothetical protein
MQERKQERKIASAGFVNCHHTRSRADLLGQQDLSRSMNTPAARFPARFRLAQ